MLPTNILLAGAALLGAVAGQACDCDPTKNSCPPNPALGNRKIDCDLTKGLCKDLKPLEGTYINKFSDKGALFSIEKDFQGPTVVSDKYILFGKADITFRAAPGAGIVTSIVFMSCDHDEIDWELIGNYDYQIQSNFFAKGDETSSDRGGNHTVSDPVNTEHTYSVEWTRDKIVWSIDGAVVRTQLASETKNGYGFPQSPVQVKIGIWVGGNAKANHWQLNWSGGRADFSKAPFNAYVKRVTVVDYAGGDSPAHHEVESYSFSDRSGSFDSIKFSPEGSKNIAHANDAEASSTSSAAASTTGKADKTSSSVQPAASSSSNSTSAAASSGTSQTPAATKPADKNSGVRSGAVTGSLVLAAAGAALMAML
ncbi:hypothetical protein VHEMI08225 [[Torrubiella] hemipterigena]|uniref:GH16 domain-containing protein n=1 Tax=[Torrubiella] hemipterigena TaxID=1531966 RepID=A0A0A1T5Z1_9HYPO|nr:hypothetical protein VHEMI08225 [[Torrubiella] hemipterigena]